MNCPKCQAPLCKDWTRCGICGLQQLKSLCPSDAAACSPPPEYKANFLWGFTEGSVEEAGYEFANAINEEYRKVWWANLKDRIKAENYPSPSVGGDSYQGIEWLACWLLDNVEGETITEEQLRPWAQKAWFALLNQQQNETSAAAGGERKDYE